MGEPALIDERPKDEFASHSDRCFRHEAIVFHLDAHLTEPQRIEHHRNRRSAHREGGNHRADQNAEDGKQNPCSNGNAGGIVDKSEEEILANIAHCRAGEPASADDTVEISFH